MKKKTRDRHCRRNRLFKIDIPVVKLTMNEKRRLLACRIDVRQLMLILSNKHAQLPFHLRSTVQLNKDRSTDEFLSILSLTYVEIELDLLFFILIFFFRNRNPFPLNNAHRQRTVLVKVYHQVN